MRMATLLQNWILPILGDKCWLALPSTTTNKHNLTRSRCFCHLLCAHYTNYYKLYHARNALALLQLLLQFSAAIFDTCAIGPFPGGIGPASGTCTAMSAGAGEIGEQCATHPKSKWSV